ncbi:hypothetical protein M1L60_11000 [Actinoplanes sp. TRM 88003]|uniref:Uncharacterized protein n=1 Tax=Paractinoplanes aksuensis TaxID=2939490 RepID=A0ABT1DM61_9ACTN|nr:hypothetical protein [Actinoplanes aksuensis]MCO8271120.1 hypothetical protein [Actinoplanes aksuensis]
MGLEIDFHDNDALMWGRRLSLVVGVVGVLLVLAAVLVSWAAPVGIFGGVAVFVAVSGRIGTALELKYGRLPLAQPVAVAHHGNARRRSMRRSSGVPWATVALGGVTLLAAFGGGDAGGLEYLFVAAGLAFVLFGLLVGPFAGFTVTPEHLHVDTAFRRTSVPRHLIGEFESDELDVRLRLRNRDFLDIRVDSPIMEYTSNGYWMNARCRFRTVAKLVRMLHEVREEPGSDQAVTHHRRPVVMALTGLAAAGILVTAVIGLMGDWGAAG